MNQGRKLVELCESWWDNPGGPSEALVAAAENFLRCLAWGQWQMSNAGPALVFSVQGAEETRLDFAFLPPGKLDPSSKVVDSGLDFASASRPLVAACREGGARYVLVTDLCRSYLYDADSDELLLHADSPQLFLREIFDEVTRECVDEGGLHEVRRPSRGMMARHLGEWEQRWIRTITGGNEEIQAIAEQFIDQLVIARFFLEASVRPAGGEQLCASFRELLSGQSTEAIGPRWHKLCHTLYTRHAMAFFQPSGRMLQLTADEPRMRSLFLEFGRMSRAKFAVPCVLESFNFGEAAEKARVRLVPEPDEEREKSLAGQSLDTLGAFKLEVDVLEEGYRAVGHWFAELVGVYRRLGVPVKPAQAPADAARQDELDLFPEAATPEAKSGDARDAVTRAVEDGLCIWYAAPRQLRTARLLTHLYILDLYKKYGASLGRFPDIDRAFRARPTLLEKEKRWIYEPPADHALGGYER